MGNCYTAWMSYSMYLKPVGIHNSCMTADRIKVKTCFTFLYEVFHQASFAIELDKIFRGWLHVCNNECIHVSHLVFRFFNFTDNTSFIRPRTCLIHEFTINYSIIYFVVFCDFIKYRLQKVHNSCAWILSPIAKLNFNQISCESIIANKRIVTVTLMVEVKCSAFLFAIGIKKCWVQI